MLLALNSCSYRKKKKMKERKRTIVMTVWSYVCLMKDDLGLKNFYNNNNSFWISWEPVGTLSRKSVGTLNWESLGTLNWESMSSLSWESVGTLNWEIVGCLSYSCFRRLDLASNFFFHICYWVLFFQDQEQYSFSSA